MSTEPSFWELPELVERFAAREPDVRLTKLMSEYPDPSAVRVLDLGCAGGRNAVLLAEAGFSVHALDGSRAMVRRTRERLAPILGPDEADRRVVVGRMDDLGQFPDAHFDLVIGLGIYHQASSPEVWERAIAETARVLAPGGRLLYASFNPETAPDGSPGCPVPDQPGMYSGFRSGSTYLIDAPELDRRLASLGLVPETPTAVVRRETENGYRVTVNGLFRRLQSSGG